MLLHALARTLAHDAQHAVRVIVVALSFATNTQTMRAPTPKKSQKNRESRELPPTSTLEDWKYGYTLTQLQIWILQRLRDGAVLEKQYGRGGYHMRFVVIDDSHVTGSVVQKLPAAIGVSFMYQRSLLHVENGRYSIAAFARQLLIGERDVNAYDAMPDNPYLPNEYRVLVTERCFSAYFTPYPELRKVT